MTKGFISVSVFKDLSKTNFFGWPLPESDGHLAEDIHEEVGINLLSHFTPRRLRLLIFGIYRTNGLPVNLPVNIFLPEQTGKKDLVSKESLGYWERLKPGC